MFSAFVGFVPGAYKILFYFFGENKTSEIIFLENSGEMLSYSDIVPDDEDEEDYTNPLPRQDPRQRYVRQIEYKQVGNINIIQYPTSYGLIYRIIPPTVGSGYNNRVGKRIYWRSLNLRILAQAQSTRATVIKIAVIYQRYRTTSLLTDPYEVYDLWGGSQGVVANLNVSAQSRYIVLREFYINLAGTASATSVAPPTGSPDSSEVCAVRNIFIDLRGLLCEFTLSTTSVESQTVAGNIYVMAFSNINSTRLGQFPMLWWAYRARYTDDFDER